MTALVFIGGAVIGSAAGAALVRWPNGMTLLRPSRSRCATCGGALRGRDLIPILSWFVSRGRCRSCSGRIDIRLPLLELGCAAGAALTVRVHGLNAMSLLLLLGVAAVLLATLTDLESMTVPDRLSLPLAAVALVGTLLLADDLRAVRAVVAWGLLLPVALHLLSESLFRTGFQRPIGGGDVKLLIGVLALASAIPGGPGAVLILAVVVGGSAAGVGLITGRLRRGDRMPFAPAIAIGYLAVVLAPRAAVPSLTTLRMTG